MQKLANEIDERMHSLGFEKENRPFSAHLTIGRIREGAVEKIIATMQAKPFGSQAVSLNEITMMRSVLHSGGSLYTPLCKIKLGSS